MEQLYEMLKPIAFCSFFILIGYLLAIFSEEFK